MNTAKRHPRSKAEAKWRDEGQELREFCSSTTRSRRLTRIKLNRAMRAQGKEEAADGLSDNLDDLTE